MRTTISVIKADIGSIGGHLLPSRRLLTSVREHVEKHGRKLLRDHWIGCTGDDVAILMTHEHGTGAAEVHELAWEAFRAGTATAREQGLYAAGQDLLKESFSGNVRGMGPASRSSSTPASRSGWERSKRASACVPRCTRGNRWAPFSDLPARRARKGERS